MSDQAIDVKTGGSTTHLIVMIVGGVLLLAGIAFILYIIFNNPVADLLGDLFNDFTKFAKGTEKAFKDCFTSGGTWTANCLWMYLGALVLLVPYVFSKLGAQTTDGASDVVKKAAFETGKSNEELATEVERYMEDNLDAAREEFEAQGLEGDVLEHAVRMTGANMLKDMAVEEVKKAKGDWEATEKRMADAVETYSKSASYVKDGTMSEEEEKEANDAAEKYVKDNPPPVEG